MTTSHRVKRLLVLFGFSLIFLQGCRQSPRPTPTATPFRPTAAPVQTKPASSPTATPLPIPVEQTQPPIIPTATATPQPFGQETIGFSVQNRPLTAYWAGTGTKKIVLIGGGETAESWFSTFQENVPPQIKLWFIPDFNPDNPDPAGTLNANGVNLTLNADSRFAGCSNQQPDPSTSGPYPFSEPESQALRNFLSDAWIVVWLTAEIETIRPGGCGQHLPSYSLASTLGGQTGLSIAADNSLTKGHFDDYLAGDGTASAVLNPNSIDAGVITALLNNFDQIAFGNPPSGAVSFEWIAPENSTQWQFPTGTFIHPIAVESLGGYIYVLDSGGVQRLDSQNPAMPETILSPGEEVAGVKVIEPLDIAADGEFFYVLDRAGDVYQLDTTNNSWSLSRYDRPVGETSAHYYLALAAQAGEQILLEGSYQLALLQTADQPDFIWPLPDHNQIDLTINQNRVYILSQSPLSQTASLMAYENGSTIASFSPGVSLHRPRQIEAAESGLYVLDQAGRRLWLLDSVSGQPKTIYQPADGLAWTAFDINQQSGQLLLAAKDKLTFFNGFNESGDQIVIQGTGQYTGPQMNDPAVLETLRGLLMPIGGSGITLRENQMPGAPRHYRYGVHEGTDFYWQAGTAVRAVAPGTVIRATTNYQLPTAETFAGWAFTVQNLGYTSPEAHDFYRGRQVWIQHENGLISRYVHLNAIDPLIVEGASVQAGQIIGAVGNTGSPVSLESPETDAHLHFELLLGNNYLGQFLRPIETREWLQIILNEQ